MMSRHVAPILPHMLDERDLEVAVKSLAGFISDVPLTTTLAELEHDLDGRGKDEVEAIIRARGFSSDHRRDLPDHQNAPAGDCRRLAVHRIRRLHEPRRLSRPQARANVCDSFRYTP